MEMDDVIVVGGGPAGASAALVLARATRRVRLFDAGSPRNAAARATHNVLTRDGTPPERLRALAFAELARYGVILHESEVTNGRTLTRRERRPYLTGFALLADGVEYRARKVLLATGLRDVLPRVPEIERYYGRGVHHCPYCDGWQYRGKPLVAYGTPSKALGLALALRTWSPTVTVLTNGNGLNQALMRRAAQRSIAVHSASIEQLVGRRGVLREVLLSNGERVRCDALFFNSIEVQRSALAKLLGCRESARGRIETRGKQRTCVDGLYLAGDADGDVQLWVVAAAEGATAAVAINRELQEEECGEMPNHFSRPRRASRS